MGRMTWALMIEFVISVLIDGAIFALALFALLDCLGQPADRFRVFSRMSKGAWTGALAAAALVSGLSCVSGVTALIGRPFGAGILSGGSFGMILILAAAIFTCVYLAGVRPNVSGKNGYGSY